MAPKKEDIDALGVEISAAKKDLDNKKEAFNKANDDLIKAQLYYNSLFEQVGTMYDNS